MNYEAIKGRRYLFKKETALEQQLRYYVDSFAILETLEIRKEQEKLGASLFMVRLCSSKHTSGMAVGYGARGLSDECLVSGEDSVGCATGFSQIVVGGTGHRMVRVILRRDQGSTKVPRQKGFFFYHR